MKTVVESLSVQHRQILDFQRVNLNSMRIGLDSICHGKDRRVTGLEARARGVEWQHTDLGGGAWAGPKQITAPQRSEGLAGIRKRRRERD